MNSAPIGVLLTVSTMVATGCPADEPPADEPEPLPVALANVDGWVRVLDPQADVFGAGPSEGVVCDDMMGYGIESLGPDLVFEVKTDLCNWFTGAQPTLVALAPGDTVAIRVWHYELVAPMPSEGYVALAIGGTIEWHATVAIPGPHGLLEGEIIVDRDVPAGTELQFHVHNHGINDWELFEITATATGEEA